VALSGSYQDGESLHVVVSPATVEVRVGIPAVTIGGAVIGGSVSPPDAGRAALGLRYPDAAEALTILGQPTPLGWVELFKVFEIVRDAVKPARLDRSGLATKEQVSAFTASANRPDVSGQEARHARMGGGPPQRMMTVSEGHEFIGNLVRAWIDSLPLTPPSGMHGDA
jgi:hypothetical protein